MTPLELDILTVVLPHMLWAVPLLCALMLVGGTAADMRHREMARRRRVRTARGLPVARPVFARSASWWVDMPRPSVRRGRHRAPRVRRPVRIGVVRRAALASAVLVDELTLSARVVTA